MLTNDNIHVPSSADGIVSGSSGVKGEEFTFGFKIVQVESRVSASCLLLFCFLFLLLLRLFAGGSVLTSAEADRSENKTHSRLLLPSRKIGQQQTV